MNKINFLFVICIAVGLVCGCGLSDDGGGAGKTRTTRSSDERAAKNNPRSSDDSDERSSSRNAPRDTAKLIGKWVWARTGSGTYSSGGAYVGGNGSRFTYEFSEDGQAEFTGIMNVMTGGCQMQVFKSKTGEASFDGETLTIDWEPAKFTRDDSCDKAGNYEKELPAETETAIVAFKESGGQNQLCLTSGGEETCYSPAE